MKLFFTRDDTTARARASWAKSIEHLIDEIDRPEPLNRLNRRLYRKDVARASVPALSEIRRVLVEPATPVKPAAMARLREFLTDGGTSPLYRGDVESARRAANELASAFVVPAAARVAKSPHELGDPRPRRQRSGVAATTAAAATSHSETLPSPPRLGGLAAAVARLDRAPRHPPVSRGATSVQGSLCGAGCRS